MLRCRNKSTHTHTHAYTYVCAWGIATAGQSLRNSVKSVLKFALFYNQCLDSKCSGVFFSSLLQSAQDVTPFLLSFYLVFPFKAMRNYLDVKHIVDRSCCAQHLSCSTAVPPQTCVSNSVISPCFPHARPNFLVSFSLASTRRLCDSIFQVDHFMGVTTSCVFCLSKDIEKNLPLHPFVDYCPICLMSVFILAFL